MTPKDRLKRIAVDFDTAIEVLCEVVLPVIEKEIKSDTYAAELCTHVARINDELRLYLERGKAEKEAILNRVREEAVILETTKYQLENATLLVEEMTLTKILMNSTRDDIKQAVIHAAMVGDKEKLLDGLRDGIRQVESV